MDVGALPRQRGRRGCVEELRGGVAPAPGHPGRVVAVVGLGPRADVAFERRGHAGPARGVMRARAGQDDARGRLGAGEQGVEEKEVRQVVDLEGRLKAVRGARRARITCNPALRATASTGSAAATAWTSASRSRSSAIGSPPTALAAALTASRERPATRTRAPRAAAAWAAARPSPRVAPVIRRVVMPASRDYLASRDRSADSAALYPHIPWAPAPGGVAAEQM